MTDTINVLLCGDANSEAVLPTLINSIVTNTKRNVHVRILTRGYSHEDFENSRLKVEFINSVGGVGHRDGRYSVINDRICYLQKITDWDKCILFDWDQLIDCDIAELYDQSFNAGCCMSACEPIHEGCLGEAWPNLGQSNTLKRILTDEEYNSPRFPMGSNVIDLKTAKAEGVLDRIVSILKRINGEDHLAMLAAFAGRVQFFRTVWNCVTNCQENSEVKIWHFSGANKPWTSPHYRDIWYSYHAVWSDLEGFRDAKDLKNSGPLFVFANPRSGSTLLLRLLNRCVTHSGKRMKMNGETPILSEIVSLMDTLTEVRQKRPNALSKTFTPFYTNGLLNAHCKSLDNFFRTLCSASTDEPYGFKQVNYGHHSKTHLKDIVFTLDRIPNAKFLFLCRAPEEVSDSMNKLKGWWKIGRSNVESIKRQTNNFEHVAHLVNNELMEYNDLLSYEKFLNTVKPLGLCISESDYKKEISKKISK